MLWLAEGASWEGFNPLGSWPRVQRALVYGQNQVPVRPPSKLHATRLLLMSPLILAQVLALPSHLPLSPPPMLPHPPPCSSKLHATLLLLMSPLFLAQVLTLPSHLYPNPPPLPCCPTLLPALQAACHPPAAHGPPQSGTGVEPPFSQLAPNPLSLWKPLLPAQSPPPFPCMLSACC